MNTGAHMLRDDNLFKQLLLSKSIESQCIYAVLSRT